MNAFSDSSLDILESTIPTLDKSDVQRNSDWYSNPNLIYLPYGSAFEGLAASVEQRVLCKMHK
jgi:hypothetical protein